MNTICRESLKALIAGQQALLARVEQLEEEVRSRSETAARVEQMEAALQEQARATGEQATCNSVLSSRVQELEVVVQQQAGFLQSAMGEYEDSNGGEGVQASSEGQVDADSDRPTWDGNVRIFSPKVSDEHTDWRRTRSRSSDGGSEAEIEQGAAGIALPDVHGW